MTFPEITPGLREVLARYCEYRNWKTVSPETVEGIRSLIERADTYEDCLAGLDWFFESDSADPYIIDRRPDLGINFLITCWERYEFFQAEAADRVLKPAGVNEYSLIRGCAS